MHMFYIPRTQPYYRQPEYNPYGYPPLRPTSSYDDFDYDDEHYDYVETKRREYLEALYHQQQQQQQQHREYERAVALENQRHRAQLAALAEREALRKQGPPYQTHPLYGYEKPQVSTLDEPVRRQQPAPMSQSQPNRHLDDWQTRLLEELYGIPAGYGHPQKKRKPFDEEEVPELEEKQHEPPPTTLHAQWPRRPTRVASTFKPQTQAHSQTAPKPQKPQSQSVRVRVISPTNSDSESDSPKRTQALTTIAEISHMFDTLCKTFTFPAGPLERNPHSSTPHLAYNAQNSVVHAYENALSELLTKLDAVESHGFKAVRDARKELVVQIERELGELEKQVFQALGVGEGEVKVEEKMDEEQVEKAVVMDVHMEDHTTSHNPTADWTTEPASTFDSIDTPRLIVEGAPTTDLGNGTD